MKINKMTKDELELLSNKDITYYLLEDSKKSINTADLFKQIVKLLELPESSFDSKIGDYYTSLATDKRFIMLEDGTWDLKSRHTSDKVAKIIDSEDEEELSDEDEESKEEMNDEVEEDSYDDSDDDIYDDSDDDLKDLVIIDEEELELEQ